MGVEQEAMEPGKTDGEEAAGAAENLPVAVPDPKLTIKENRLAGSIECMNCGTELQGPFCHYCGQPDKNLVRFFPALMREMLEDFMDFDSRFMRTLKPLMFKPGKLTRDYLNGRRFRYVPPLRLYIFSSLVLFFLIAVLASDSLQFETDTASGSPNLTIKMDEEDRKDLEEALAELEEVNPGLADQLESQIDEAIEEGAAAAEEAEPQETDDLDKIDFDINGKPWDPDTNPIELPLMPGFIDRWFNQQIAGTPAKFKEIKENPNLWVDKIIDVLPGTMFVLLPLVALMLKFWYLFAKKYFVEHLIFVLHNHAFIFVAFILMLLFGTLGEWREPDGEGPLTKVILWIDIALWTWIPIYMLVSLKRVYQQGWVLTVGKYLAVGISYLCILALVTIYVAALSFVLS